MSCGLTHDEFWGLEPTKVGKLVELKRQKEYDLAYYQAMVTASSVWGKAPERPIVGEKKEQTEEEMLENFMAFKRRNS